MSQPVSPFTAIYAAWLDTFRTLIPGGSATPPAELTPKEAQAEAHREWEDEGGSIRPDMKQDQEAGQKSGPKIPF